MTHNDSMEDFYSGSDHDRGSLPRAKPEERLTGGLCVEDFFGICAEEIDDEFMEAVLSIRRGVWPKAS